MTSIRTTSGPQSVSERSIETAGTLGGRPEMAGPENDFHCTVENEGTILARNAQTTGWCR